MPDAVTDTHALLWHLESDPRLSPSARAYFEACDAGDILIYVPTICLVEIVYLQEKGRIALNLKAQLDVVLQAGTSGLVLSALTGEVVDALVQIPRITVPDMPDRVIAATAMHLSLPLISRDHDIQVSGLNTIW